MKTKIKIKTIPAVVSVSLLTKIVLASLFLVMAIAIGVVAVFGYIAYETISVIHNIHPQSDTNDVTITTYTNVVGEVGLATPPPVYSLKPSGKYSGGGFSFQYGLNQSSGVPWVVCGTNIPQVQVLETNLPVAMGTITPVISTDTEFMFDMLDYYGSVIRFDYVSYDYGQTYQCSSFPVYPIPVVIERSTNMVDWGPIYTNATFGVFNVEVFSDTNSPPEKAFYRSGQEFKNYFDVYQF